MRLRADLKGDLREQLEREYLKGERAVTLTMRRAGRRLQKAWQGQVTAAGLGQRLARTIRAETYPVGQNSMNAAALVYTKAPKLIAAFDEGPMIRSKEGFWLAIPLPTAGRGRFGRRMTPLDWERRTGKQLRFVYRSGRSALLVADDARLSSRGLARNKGGRRRKDGILSGAQTVPIFVLVPQVKLRKRLDLDRDVQRIANGLAADVVATWDRLS
ncbi:DUF6441 family protein [Aestuariibius insulae]|uniref:DUF6441 family protein n=1 Tax=Aestuariibius insulae TaxID=2058287 RepID=UPI00345E4229